jgi:hypothetical protein
MRHDQIKAVRTGDMPTAVNGNFSRVYSDFNPPLSAIT